MKCLGPSLCPVKFVPPSGQRWLVIGIFGALGLLVAANELIADDSNQATIVAELDDELRHAETYYWFGMAEQGNKAAFHKGLQHLLRAQELLDESESSQQQKRHYQGRIDGLGVDLVEQLEIAHDTLFGIFPLTRFLTRSLFAESTTLDTFEVIDDPTVMASTSAAKKLALTTITEWKQRHQLDVAFTSVPYNPQLENEALYVFNSHPKFFVHNQREVIDALDTGQLAEFQSGKVTPAIKQRLLDAFGINQLLVVLVRETDVIDNDYFYVLEGKIYGVASPTPTHDFAVMGFSRDRNSWFNPIILTNVLLLGLTFLAFWMQARIRRRATVRARMATFVFLPLIAFAVGRTTPWFLGPLIKSVSPIPETLAIVSFWVPAIAGTALTVLPMAGFWIIAKRLSTVWPMFNLDARTVSVFFGIGAGFASYFSVPLYLYLQQGALLVLLPTTLGVLAVAYLLGRALDSVDPVPTATAILPCVLSLLLGAAAFHAQPNWIWSAAALALVCCPLVSMNTSRAVASAIAKQGEEIQHAESAVAEESNTVVDVNRLGELAEHPKFQELAAYRRCRDAAQPALRGQTVHLGLYGGRGCGAFGYRNGARP